MACLSSHLSPSFCRFLSFVVTIFLSVLFPAKNIRLVLKTHFSLLHGLIQLPCRYPPGFALFHSHYFFCFFYGGCTNRGTMGPRPTARVRSCQLVFFFDFGTVLGQMAAVEVPPFLPLLPHPRGVGTLSVGARSLRHQLLLCFFVVALYF